MESHKQIARLFARLELTLYCRAENIRRSLGLPCKPIDKRQREAWQLAKRLYG